MTTDIEAILRATIQAKVVEAFNTTPEMIDKLVQAAFAQEVDRFGMKPDRYLSDREKMPYMDWLVGEEIRKAAREAVQEYMAAHRDEVKAKVAKAIESGDFGNQIGAKVAEAMADEYRWSFQIERRERD